ncbi:MAG: peptidase, partial [Actinomyces bowdenii]|nr:peptidase [Actinomyces bowdenii]
MSFSEPVGTRGKAIASALAVLLALTASALTFFHSSAHAANNPRITISNLSLVISSGTGEDDPNDHSSRVDDIMRLSFDWDASNANASAGDSFRIGLPELFHNREQLTQDLKVSHGGSEVTIGECILGQQDIVCTFNGQLDTLKGQGFNNPKGSGSALLKAVKATDEANASIDANGTITAVPIPGGSIADNTGFDYEPERLRKWAFGVTNDSKAIDWELSFGTPGIQQLLQAQGTTLTVDGQTRSTITLTDEISPGQEYSTDKSEWKLGIGTSAGRNSIFGTVTDATGNDQNTAMGDYDMTVDINGNRATITITGPFVQDTNYHVYYPTVPTTADHTVQPGVVYTNNAALEGSAAQTTYSVYYVRSFNINVELKPGFGGFSATKLL